MRIVLAVLLLVLASVLSAQTDFAAGRTLTGQPLRSPAWSEDVRSKLEQDLAIAEAVFAVAPDREDSYIWLGRRFGYLGRYPEAIDVFTAGLDKFPQSYKLHRFRGRHRARNRDFSGAIEDYRAGLEKMRGIPDSFEPDGIPNNRGLTISTYRANLHYYLGQTSFATGDYPQMIRELDLSGQSPIALDIEDHRIAVVFWKYMAHMKLGETTVARGLLDTVPAELDLIENESYHRAIKVLQGVMTPTEVQNRGDSLARFALGMRLQFDGDEVESTRVLTELVTESALGYWPAEVELVPSSAR
jgi:tetratricopeptide (TPR) repeat protein